VLLLTIEVILKQLSLNDVKQLLPQLAVAFAKHQDVTCRISSSFFVCRVCVCVRERESVCVCMW